MEQLHESGFYEVFLPKRKQVFRYRLRATLDNGETHEIHDAYSFLPTLGDQDLYLFNEGNEHRLYDKLGAHLRRVNEVPGVSFAVWAPNAKRVSVVGNFNGWDGRYHPMRPLGASGVWELFVPGLGRGELYKFELWDVRGHIRLKTDPFGSYFEAPPGNASVVHETGRYVWNDAEWMEKRRVAAGDRDQPMSIYEVHLGSWKRR
ncbi:MAG TPA: 1,4-alpha-glucan branching enzyme, partial [Opitutaceae bacterium]|nr:1,4-alpha-glucan branching enzyme [Opitutaceae bacterium]